MPYTEVVIAIFIIILMLCLLIIACVNIAFIHKKKQRESLRISQGFAIGFIIIIIILFCAYSTLMYTQDGCKKIYEQELGQLRLSQQ
jgi:hypothetical protein